MTQQADKIDRAKSDTFAIRWCEVDGKYIAASKVTGQIGTGDTAAEAMAELQHGLMVLDELCGENPSVKYEADGSHSFFEIAERALRWRRFGAEKPPIGEKVLAILHQPGFSVSTQEAEFDGEVWDHANWCRPMSPSPSDLWLPMPRPQEGK